MRHRSRIRARSTSRRRRRTLETLEPRTVLNGGPVISEFLAANGSGLADEDGDRSDWIELHNPTAAAVNLGAWFLSDDARQPAKWEIPAVNLPANGYLVIFASGKDRAAAGSELHTNFSLDAGGEYLALVRPDMTTQQEFGPTFPQQFSNVSFGMSGVEFRYFAAPTPAAANSTTPFDGKVADTKFSVNRGFFDAPFQLEITSATPDAEIRYTTDGSTPNSRSPIYRGPITISTTTTVRAQASKDGFLPTNLDTQTYVFLADVITQGNNPPGYPPNFSNQPSDYEMDPQVTNDPAYRDLMDEALRAVPTLSIVTDNSNLFASNGIYQNPQQEGVAWERPTSVELIYPDGTEGFQIDAGLRIQGGASRNPNNSPKHALRLLFKEEYGASKLNFPFFPDSDVDTFDTITLRAGYNNSWTHWSPQQRSQATFIHDQWARDVQLAMNQPASHGTYMHLYINGIYWGLYNPVERPSAAFAAEHLGGEKEEWDALNSGDPVDGDRTAWNTMMNLANAGLASASAYAEIQEYLDVPNLIDYMIMNIYGGNQDWDHHNWYAARRRMPGEGYKFFSWDAERILENVTTNIVGENENGNPSRLYNQLKANAEFRQLFADHLHRHFFNGGTLTPEAATATFMARADEIDLAVIAESARWGDYRRDVHVRGSADLYTRNEHWRTELNRLRNEYFPRRTTEVLTDFRAIGLYPTVTAPSFNQHGGQAPAGFEVVISGASDPVYYTLDGSDPRLPGGAVSPDAILYEGPAVLTASGVVKARAFASRGGWSALNEATFIIGSPTLAVTEINYNPHAARDGEPAVDNDEFEFIEIQNTGQLPVDLFGVRFMAGVAFDFTGADVSTLAPGEHAVLVKNPTAFAARYGAGVAIAGTYAGSLDNGGELVRLVDALGGVIQEFTYNDSGEWPGRADGNASSLEIEDTAADYNAAGSWRASTEFGGSPGGAGMGAFADVVVNEVLSRPLLDGGDVIELFNTSSEPVEVSGWFVSDSNNNYFKFTMPTQTIPGGGYLLLDESDFNPTPGLGTSFALDGLGGDDVWLVAADAAGRPARFADRVEFGGSAAGESFGRWPNGGGGLFPMTSVTLGAANSGPRIGPVVISELHYNPTGDAAGDDLEFIELHNRTSSEIDLEGWRLDGVNYPLPAGAVIPGGGVLVVTPFDPNDAQKADAFRAHYNLDAGVPLIGGYPGRLDNGGERLQLLRPDAVPAGASEAPLVLMDQVDYNNAAPWPIEADGGGDSLHRQAAEAFGDFAASWRAGAPTPGAAAFTPRVPGDANGDGLVDLADLNAVRNNFGGSGLGDVNDDGVVDLADLNAVRNNFGAMAAPQAAPTPTPQAAPTPVAASGLNNAAITSSSVVTAADQVNKPAARVLRGLATVMHIAPDAAPLARSAAKSIDAEVFSSMSPAQRSTVHAAPTEPGERTIVRSARRAIVNAQRLRAAAVDQVFTAPARDAPSSAHPLTFRSTRGHQPPADAATPANPWDEALAGFSF